MTIKDISDISTSSVSKTNLDNGKRVIILSDVLKKLSIEIFFVIWIFSLLVIFVTPDLLKTFGLTSFAILIIGWVSFFISIILDSLNSE